MCALWGLSAGCHCWALAVCTLEPGWCRCEVPIQGATARCPWPCAFWSLGAGAAAAAGPLQSAAARCPWPCAFWSLGPWPCALWSSAAAAGGVLSDECCCFPQVSFAIWGLRWHNYGCHLLEQVIHRLVSASASLQVLLMKDPSQRVTADSALKEAWLTKQHAQGTSVTIPTSVRRNGPVAALRKEANQAKTTQKRQ